MKNLIRFPMKIPLKPFENPVNFLWINSQDFHGFLVHSAWKSPFSCDLHREVLGKKRATMWWLVAKTKEPQCELFLFNWRGLAWKAPKGRYKVENSPESKAFGPLKLSIIHGVVQCTTDHVATVRVIRDCQSIYNSAGFSSVSSTCPCSSVSSSTFSFFDFLGANHSSRKPL